jgi:uncharacterized protein YqfB (UPF0267 family)
MHYLKVTGHDGLVRDTSNGAIINSNKVEYEKYLKQKQVAEQRKLQLDKISEHSEQIQNIKTELGEIKSLILQLLNK